MMTKKPFKFMLTLPIKAKWYDMIERGIMTEVYRENTSFWRRRLIAKPFTHIRLRYGYTQRTMIFEIEKISAEKGNPACSVPCNKDVLIIKLGAMCDPIEMFFGRKECNQ